MLTFKQGIIGLFIPILSYICLSGVIQSRCIWNEIFKNPEKAHISARKNGDKQLPPVSKILHQKNIAQTNQPQQSPNLGGIPLPKQNRILSNHIHAAPVDADSNNRSGNKVLSNTRSALANLINQPQGAQQTFVPNSPKKNLELQIKNKLAEKHYFVLLHGVMEHSSRFYDHVVDWVPNLKQDLAAKGFKNIEIILSSAREGLASCYHSLTTQASNVISEIKNKVNNDNVHLIGYSQGGLVVDEIEVQNHNELNIVSSTYISTPFSGVGAMAASRADVKTLINNQSVLDALEATEAIDINSFPSQMLWKQLFIKGASLLGIRKLLPAVVAFRTDNELVRERMERIRQGSQTVPHLIIGCYASFKELFPDINEKLLKELDVAYGQFLQHNDTDGIVGPNKLKNDTMVPLRSQLARRNSIEEIDLSKPSYGGFSMIPEPKGCVNTIQSVFSQTAHAGGIPILGNNLWIKQGTEVLQSAGVTSLIAAFVYSSVVQKSGS